MYPVTTPPTGSDAAFQETASDWAPGVATRPVGATGSALSVAATTFEPEPVPTALTAKTSKLYVVPSTNEETVVFRPLTVVTRVQVRPPSFEL